MNPERIPRAVRFAVPNALTLANLFCGCLGIVGALNGGYDWAWMMIILAALLDLTDLLQQEYLLNRRLHTCGDHNLGRAPIIHNHSSWRGQRATD